MSTLIMCIIDLLKTKTRPWRHIYHDIENPRPKSHDIEIPSPKNRDIEKRRQLTTTSWFQDIFSEEKKPRHQDSKAEKPRYRDSKTKKPRHWVSAEFWPLFPLIDFFEKVSFAQEDALTAYGMFYACKCSLDLSKPYRKNIQSPAVTRCRIPEIFLSPDSK